MNRHILLTGAGGFVGTYMRPALAARWPGAIVTGLSVDGRTDTKFIRADLRDAAAIAAAVRMTMPDVIVHLAGQSSVVLGQTDIEGTWAINLAGSLNLALAVAAHAPDATLLFASSSEVYGRSFLSGFVNEGTAASPLNAYAKSKLLTEQMFASVLPEQTRLIVARPFNHTGPGQRETFVLPSFARQIARIESGMQPPRLTVGNLEVQRDFLDVRDVVAAYIALIEVAPRLPKRFTCNIASGAPRFLRELVDILCKLASVPLEIAVDPKKLRPIDVPIACGDASLLRCVSGWQPNVPIENTLKHLLDEARRVL